MSPDSMPRRFGTTTDADAEHESPEAPIGANPVALRRRARSGATFGCRIIAELARNPRLACPIRVPAFPLWLQ